MFQLTCCCCTATDRHDEGLEQVAKPEFAPYSEQLNWGETVVQGAGMPELQREMTALEDTLWQATVKGHSGCEEPGFREESVPLPAPTVESPRPPLSAGDTLGTYVARLDMKTYRTLGLQVDTLDETLAIVSCVRGDSAAAWNASCPKGADIRETDRLVEVNSRQVIASTPGFANQILDLKRSGIAFVNFKFQRARSKTLRVDREPGKTLGLVTYDLGSQYGFLVKSVKEGRIAKWNDEHPENAVEPGDRIVEVNGAKDSFDDMIQALKANVVEMKLISWKS